MTSIDALANELARQGRSSEIEAELEKIDPATLPRVEAEAWWHLYGAMAFRRGAHQIALERFHEAHALFPKSGILTFSLGQEWIRLGEIEQGFALFHEARFPAVPGEYAMVEARYAYLCSRHDDARRFLQPLLKAYVAATSLDLTFLLLRGLPSFSEYWRYLAAVSVLSGDWTDLDRATDTVKQSCVNYNFERLQLERECYRDRQPRRLLRSGDPTGFTRMQAAVIGSEDATSFAEVRERIGGVILTPKDFPWLADVANLALAEYAGRFGEERSQRSYESAFRRRQPLLFEPNIALQFWLLEAQERLKGGLFERS